MQHLLAGVGGALSSPRSLATRTTFDGSYFSSTAHNEYLEALIEGGVARFALTVALAIFAVWSAARSYRETRDPLLLGCFFALAAVAIHSIGDFGLHVPSVAIGSAVVAAYAAVRRETGDQIQEIDESVAATTGGVIAGSVLLLLAALVVVLGEY